MPGIAQGRASVSGSRLYGWKPSGLVVEFHGNLGKLVHGRNLPGLGAIGQITVGEHDDRHHVFQGDAAGFHGDPEAVARRACGQDRNGRLGVAREHGLQQVGLSHSLPKHQSDVSIETTKLTNLF